MFQKTSEIQLAQANSQLSVDLYFDDKILELEQRLIFDVSANYAGHLHMVPELNDYRPLELFDNSRLLVNRGGAVSLLSNVCRHRQAIMVAERGNGENIVCPLHRWTYSNSGELIGAPHFAEKPCLNLDRLPLNEWHGLQFTGPRQAASDLLGMHLADMLDFTGYKFDRAHIHDCQYNWKTFIEVYLEDYHVGPFHPGLGKFVSCDELSWQFEHWYSVQRVGTTSWQKPGSSAYAKWQKAVLDFNGGKLPEHGAIWLTYYPNIMVEWYPHVLVVSTLHPLGVNRTRNIVEFYYPEEIYEFEREFIEAQQLAYLETAVEDDEIAERMDRGRYALWRQGRNEVGPYQSPMEDGMQHFHEFYRSMLAGHL